MAGQATVLVDGSRLSQLDQRLLVLERFLALISGLAVFSLMVLAVVSVSGRNALNAPLPGYVDWIEQAMPLIAFLGISYVQRDGGISGWISSYPACTVELCGCSNCSRWF